MNKHKALGALGVFGLMVLALLTCWATPAHAHELSITTATVTLRKGHIHIKANIDLIAWLQALDNGKRPFPIERLIQIDPKAFKALHTKARAQLAKGAQIFVDGRALPVASIRFPGFGLAQKLARTLMLTKAMKSHVHGKKVPVILEARVKHRPRSLALKLPATLGPVLVRLIEPKQQLVQRGQPAAFQLSHATKERKKKEKPTKNDMSLSIILFVAMFGFGAWGLDWRRRAGQEKQAPTQREERVTSD